MAVLRKQKLFAGVGPVESAAPTEASCRESSTNDSDFARLHPSTYQSSAWNHVKKGSIQGCLCNVMILR